MLETIRSHAVLLALLGAAPLQGQNVFDTPDPLDQGLVTGIEVGEKIPDFRLPDPSSRLWGFDDFTGPNGAVLLFYRSADW